jgi:thymidylate kinase
MPTPEIIVITGPDGSGKSTACEKLIPLLKDAVSVSIWDSMLKTGKFAKEPLVEYLGELDQVARTLLLFHAMRNSLDLALKQKPEVILVDGYFYKYAASELTYGTKMEVIRGAALGFPRPSFTLFLEVDPKEASERKTSQSAYESGEEFISFQEKMLRSWKLIEAEYGPWRKISTKGGAQKVVDEIIRELKARGLCGK